MTHKMVRPMTDRAHRMDLETKRLEADCNDSSDMMYIPHIRIHNTAGCSILFHIGTLRDHGMTHKTDRLKEHKVRRIDLEWVKAYCIRLYIRTLSNHGILHKIGHPVMDMAHRMGLGFERLEADCNDNDRMMYNLRIRIHNMAVRSMLFHIGTLTDYGISHKTDLATLDMVRCT